MSVTGTAWGGGRDGRRVRWDWWDGVSLGDKLVGRLESWVSMRKKCQRAALRHVGNLIECPVGDGRAKTLVGGGPGWR